MSEGVYLYKPVEPLRGNPRVRLCLDVSGKAVVDDNLNHDESKGPWKLPRNLRKKKFDPEKGDDGLNVVSSS